MNDGSRKKTEDESDRGQLAYGGPEVLAVAELPDPVPAADEVLIALGGVRADRRRGVHGAAEPWARWPRSPALSARGPWWPNTQPRLGEGTAGRCHTRRHGQELSDGSYAELVTAPPATSQVATSFRGRSVW